MEQAHEHFVEPPGELADTDHGDIEGREHAVLARHRHRQRVAALQALAGVLNDRRHGQSGRFLQARQGPRDRDPRLQQRMQLPAEHEQIFLQDFGAPAPGQRQGRSRHHGRRRRFDADRRAAGVDQLTGDGGRARALENAFAQTAVGVACAVAEGGHRPRRVQVSSCAETRIASTTVVRPSPASRKV